MNALSVIQKIQTILDGYTTVPVTKDARLIEDLGLDSFLVVYFLTEVESQFGIDIDASEYTHFITIRDVMERVCG